MKFDEFVEAFEKKDPDELMRERERNKAREEVSAWLTANGCKVRPGSVPASLVIKGRFPLDAPPGWKVESWSEGNSRIYRKDYFTVFVDSV